MRLYDIIPPDSILTSGQLAARLIATGTSHQAARKAMSRNRDPAVWILPVSLPRRVRMFARRDSVRNTAFYQKLATALNDLRPGLARTILALLQRRILLRFDAQRLLAAPSQPRSSRTPTYAAELSVLAELGLCKVEGTDTALERITINHLAGTQDSHRDARTQRVKQIVDRRLTRLVIDQLRNQAIVSWNGHTVPEPGSGSVEFSTFAFSAFSYSRLDPLLRRTAGVKPKPTPVLFDVYSRDCGIHDVDGFLHRLARITSNRNARMPALGVVVAHSFSGDAWTAAKRGGLLTINLHQSYGKAALATLAKMEGLLQLVGAHDTVDERLGEVKYDDLAADVEALRVHPYVAELRSLGLEVVAAVILRAKGWEDLCLGLTVKHKETHREIDVIGRRGGEEEVYLVECKAAHEEKELDPGYVCKFFTETVPAALKRFPNVRKCYAELWTTGRLGKQAKDALANIAPPRRTTVVLREKPDIIALVPPTLSRCKRLIETLSLPN